MRILVINGPNLNMLGIREKEIYGTETYDDLVKYILRYQEIYNSQIEIFQYNGEGQIIDKIQEAYFMKVDAIIINPGAYTHYSYAIRDALLAVNIRTIEVHLSDISKRDEFRKHSVITDVCEKSFFGKKFHSYGEAIDYLHQ
ncbi:MAG: 3-dehydroquinate dehydratase [Bacilli bacterium]|nr:3-dehydroquinate dehydratase [Bacilli bacterium]MDD3171129.1 3-dehydroquinate dehydratase [Bacilli bacterium]